MTTCADLTVQVHRYKSFRISGAYPLQSIPHSIPEKQIINRVDRSTQRILNG